MADTPKSIISRIFDDDDEFGKDGIDDSLYFGSIGGNKVTEEN